MLCVRHPSGSACVNRALLFCHALETSKSTLILNLPLNEASVARLQVEAGRSGLCCTVRISRFTGGDPPQRVLDPAGPGPFSAEECVEDVRRELDRDAYAGRQVDEGHRVERDPHEPHGAEQIDHGEHEDGDQDGGCPEGAEGGQSSEGDGEQGRREDEG